MWCETSKREEEKNKHSKLHLNHLLSPPEYIFKFRGCLVIPLRPPGRGMCLRLKVGGGTVSREVGAYEVWEGRWAGGFLGVGEREKGGWVFRLGGGEDVAGSDGVSFVPSAPDPSPRCATCCGREEGISRRWAARSRSASPRPGSLCRRSLKPAWGRRQVEGQCGYSSATEISRTAGVLHHELIKRLKQLQDYYFSKCRVFNLNSSFPKIHTGPLSSASV